MITWTEPAREALDRYLDGLRAALVGSDMDLEKVALELRGRVEEELSAADIQVATRETVQWILARMAPMKFGGTERSAKHRFARITATLCAFGICVLIGAVLFFAPSSASRTVVSIADVVRMAHNAEVQRVTGLMHIRAGAPPVVALTGRVTTNPADGARRTYEFQAEGKVTETQLGELRASNLFTELPSTTGVSRMVAQIVPLLILLMMASAGIALFLAMLRAQQRVNSRG